MVEPWLRRLLVLSGLLIGSGSLAQPVDSLSIKIGQMILIGFPGTEVDPLVLDEVRAGKVGSIIMFEKNIPGSGKTGPRAGSSFAPLKKVLWTYRQAAPIPLLVCIDEEGGRVNRLKEKYGFPRSLSARNMGRAPSLDSVRFYAESTAATLAGLGINVNFAPVVDLGVDTANTVIYKVGRSFSANPDSVALMAGEFIKPHRRFGVITVLKHFPGHGSSKADTHLGVADVTNLWTTNELIPYERLIERGEIDAVMTAHIVNKKLDPRALPGTLSSRMIDSLLRKQMHFNGVVFSDDMQMFAIEKEYGVEEAIRLSVNAGVDILCFSNNITGSKERAADKVHGIIRSLVDKGLITKERIDESYRRIMTLKSRLQPVDHSAAPKEIKEVKETAEVKQLAPEENKKKKKKKKRA